MTGTPKKSATPTDKSLKILEDARSTLFETEEVAAKTLAELQRQRETMLRTKENQKKTQAKLKESESLIDQMLKCWRG